MYCHLMCPRSQYFLLLICTCLKFKSAVLPHYHHFTSQLIFIYLFFGGGGFLDVHVEFKLTKADQFRPSFPGASTFVVDVYAPFHCFINIQFD